MLIYIGYHQFKLAITAHQGFGSRIIGNFTKTIL